MIAVFAPGQGAQSPGMLAPWLELPGVSDQVAAFSDATGLDLERLGTTASAEEITRMIVEEADAAERRMAAAAQRAAEADRQRRTERPAPTIDPRPAPEGPRG